MAALAAAVLLPAPTALARGQGRIVVSGDLVRHVGAWHVARSPTLRAAIRAFGRPSRLRKTGGARGCIARWRGAGVRAVFANFGGVPRRRGACHPRYGRLQEATASSAGWATGRGLAIGDTRAELIDLHPDAEHHGRATWWLAQTYVPYGDGGDVPTLAAVMRSGVVSSFYVYVGAAGD